MSKLKLFLLSLSFILAIPFLSLAEDTLTITTYYPSPYGVYREMRSQRMAIGYNYIDNPDYTWEEENGDGGEIDYLADLVVEGNVGIGTTAPGQKLDVTGNIRASLPTGYANFRVYSYSPAIYLHNTYTGGQSWQLQSGGAVASNFTIGLEAQTPAMVVSSTGYVSIGTVTPTRAKLDVTCTGYHPMAVERKGDAGPLINFYQDGVVVGNIYSSAGHVIYNTSSDIRLKENIRDLQNALGMVSQIKPREFTWKKTKKYDVGFIAQELEQVYPQAVYTPLDPEEMKAIDYAKITPLLVGAIQELKAENVALKAEVKQIKEVIGE
ncbi:MAG: tail fiber domain-containing protein [Candidatus Omnitrophota bacterium]